MDREHHYVYYYVPTLFLGGINTSIRLPRPYIRVSPYSGQREGIQKRFAVRALHTNSQKHAEHRSATGGAWD